MPSKRGKQILDFVIDYRERHEYSPSFKEIKRHLGLSSFSTIHHHIKNLEKEGLIIREKNQRRAIQPKRQPSDLVKIPLLGTIAAGEPIEAIENKKTIEVPKSQLSKSGEHYALSVRGNSMLDEGIQDKDTVIVRKQPTVENGETAVALVNGNEATLKKIYREKNQFRLQPANSELKPIYTKDLTIQGKVISVIRNLEETKLPSADHNIRTIKTEEAKMNNIRNYLNKVFLGDIMDLLKKLPNNSVDMVFGDPDYNVGLRYGDKKYTKNFDEYISWYIELTKESMRVLKSDGNLFMMNYPKQNAHLRVKYLDNAYPLIYEYVWAYNTNVGHSPNRFTTAHRTILHILKTKHNKFYKDNVALPYKNPTDRRIRQNLKNGSKGRMPYCFDAQTEILTTRGFIPFKKLTIKDDVASLNSDNQFCWVKPFDIIKEDYAGNMYLYDGLSVNFCVTPNHNMYVKKSYNNKNYQFMQIKEMNGGYYYLKGSIGYKGNETDYFYLTEVEYDAKHKYLNKGKVKIKMDDWLSFFGLYISEGCVNRDEYSVLIYEEKHRKQIKEILSRIPFYFKELRKNEYRCRNKQLFDYLKIFGKAKDKYILQEFLNLSKRQLTILYESLMIGNGNKQNEGNWNYSTISKKLADNVQEILIKLGYNSYIYVDNRKGKPVQFGNRRDLRKSISYVVRRKISRTVKIVRENLKVVDYKGKVYCCSVPSGIILTRRNGQIMLSGNSWFYFDLVKNVSKEKTFHACQIPQNLTEMLIKACTMPNDIVLILFGGSGSELEVCKLLNRQYISSEIDPKYYEIITDRLKNGYIREKYKLQLRKEREEKTSELSLFSTAV